MVFLIGADHETKKIFYEICNSTEEIAKTENQFIKAKLKNIEVLQKDPNHSEMVLNVYLSQGYILTEEVPFCENCE